MTLLACAAAMTLPAGAASDADAGAATRVATASVDAKTGASASAAGSTPTAARQRELIALLRDDCGACHGMRRTGGLGPALTPEALAGKPAESLVATVMSGRPGTAMPPWRPFMSESDAAWLVRRLQQGADDRAGGH